MKRIALKLVVFLLLGGVVNVGVAWGCAEQSVARESLPPLVASEASVLWERLTSSGITAIWVPRDTDVNTRWTGPGVTEVEMGDFHLVGQRFKFIVSGSAQHRMLTVRDVGMPMRCHRYVTRFNVIESLVGEGLPERSPSLEEWLRDQLAMILPLGFLINTVFYAMILWLLCAAPFTARRLIRKRRGRCVRCGYDLRHAEHDVCPECGSAVKGARRGRGPSCWSGS